MSRIVPSLWFANEAEEAARFYVSIFPNSKLGAITRFGPGAPGPEGAAMAVEFELDGQRFLALNGAPGIVFNETVSFTIHCDTQAEVDEYWAKLTDGGEAGVCGWLKDRYGVSWQVVPRRLPELLGDPDPGKVQRVVAAMLAMRKFDIAEQERAAAGG